MKRVVLVLSLVAALLLPSVGSVARDAAGLPKGPHYKGDGWELTVMAVLAGTEFGDPLNWGPNEDGRQFVLVTLRAKNTNKEDHAISLNDFAIVDGDDFVFPNEKLSSRPEGLHLDPMGDDSGTTLVAGEIHDFILGWRVSPELDTFTLIFYGKRDKQIDLQPWVDLDIDPAELVPDQAAPTPAATKTPVATNTPKPPTATATLSPDDITPAEQDYLDAVITGVGRLTDASGELGRQFSDAGENALLFVDRDWISDTDEQLQVYTDLNNEAQDLDPSDRQTAIQDLWLQITGLVADAASNYRIGILTIDGPSFDLANSQITESAGLVDDLTAAVTAFHDDPASFGTGRSGTSNSGRSGGQTQGDTIDGPVANCDAFSNYDQAQDYYADHPEEQPVIDPDSDGVACEVHFGRG